MTSKDLNTQIGLFENTSPMPVLFVGHGSPMNAIEKNEFSTKWKEIGEELPKPQAILCISAHWETRETLVTAMENPKTIHDFWGFPKELYSQEYYAEGSPYLANEIRENTKGIELDYNWGFDHGSWSILKHFYPNADIPVLQLSINHTQSLQWHYDFAKELAFLRQKGVLIVGSGNMIHNLRTLQVPNDDFNSPYAFDWAFEINSILKQKIFNRDHQSLIGYESLSKDIQLAIPTQEHYIPMLYALALQADKDKVSLFNDKIIAGSLSMLSFIIK